MKASEITSEAAAEFIKLDEAPEEMDMYISAAKSYVRSYTNLKDKEIDEHEDMTIAIMVLVQDMYDNRSMYVDSSNVNKVVSSILDMHRRNLVV